MLHTLKYLKKNLFFKNNFSAEAAWNFDNLDLNKDMIDSKNIENFINSRKDEIVEWLKTNSKNDKFKDHIWFKDFNWNWKAMVNLQILAKKIISEEITSEFLKNNGKWKWIKLDLFLDKLNEFAWERNKTLDNSRNSQKELKQELGISFSLEEKLKQNKGTQDINNLPEEQWNPIILNFDVKNFKSNVRSNEVKELQQALVNEWFNLKVDGLIWKRTIAAINQYKKWLTSTPNNYFKDGRDGIVLEQFNSKTWSNKAARNAETPFSWRKDVSLDKTQGQIEKTKQSLVDLNERMLLAKELNGKLSDYFFREKSWYSIEALLRKVFNKDKYSKIITDKNQYELLLKDDNSKKKLENALLVLNWTVNLTRDERDRWITAKDVAKEKLGKTMDFALKVAPWLAGIYLWDIPLPFAKEAMKWVEINKSKPFMDWIAKWMPWEFKDYLKDEKNNPTPRKEFASLADMLSRTKLSKAEQAKILSWNLDWLDKKTEEIVLSYIEHILLPDLKILEDDSFNVFEKIPGFRDEKYKKIEEIIKDLEKSVKNKSIKNLPNVSLAFKLLREEWDTQESFIEQTEWSNDYVNSISWDNKRIQERFNKMLKNTDEKTANEYFKIFALVDLGDLEKMWVWEKDKKWIQELLQLLNTNYTKNDILNWQKRNKGSYNFIKALGDRTAMQRYQLSNIPKGKLKYIDAWKWNSQDSSHGRSYLKLSNSEALAAAELETPEKGKNAKSVLALAYKSFIEKWDISWMTYEDFRNAFANKENIPISEAPDWKILNTWRNEKQAKMTSFKELAKQRGDTHVFKLAPITKSYEFFQNWEQVKMEVSYNLYMRPDCTNPLIIPGTINVSKAGKPIDEGQIASLIAVDGKLPVVIPWVLFAKWGWSGGWSNNHVETKPGETMTKGPLNMNATWAHITSWTGQTISNANISW